MQGVPLLFAQGQVQPLAPLPLPGITMHGCPVRRVLTSAVSNPSVSPTTTTTYTLTETITATGCTSSNAVVITVNALPTANAGSAASICTGTSTTIGAASTAGHTYSWVSNPAGFTSAVSNPIVSPTTTTTYTLTETITATGCTKSIRNNYGKRLTHCQCWKRSLHSLYRGKYHHWRRFYRRAPLPDTGAKGICGILQKKPAWLAGIFRFSLIYFHGK